MIPVSLGAAQMVNLIELPSTFFTFSEDWCINSLSTKQGFPNLYYATRMIPKNLIVSIELNLMTKEDVQSFQQFWYSDLNNGLEPFKITLPIFGEQHEYAARFINDLSARWKNNILPKTQQMQIEILDDIEDKFNEDRFRVYLEAPTGGEITFKVDGNVIVDWGYDLLDYYGVGEITGEPFGYVKIKSREVIREFAVVSGETITSGVVERALDVRTADAMFTNLPLLQRLLFGDAPSFRTIDDLANNTPQLCDIVGLTLTDTLTAKRAFKGTGIPTIDIDTQNIEIFDEMFHSTPNLVCVQKLNTLNSISTTGMFDDTPKLLYPNAADQAAILAGADWENPNSCVDDYELWVQNLFYNNDNIKLEFDTLVNATTDNNTVRALGDGAVALSTPIVPEEEDRVFTKISGASETPCKSDEEVEFKAVFAYNNISHSDSTANTLFTFANVLTGSKITIVKDDDSIHEMVVVSVDYPSYVADGGSNASTTDATQGGTGKANASYNDRSAHLAFDNDRNTLWDGGKYASLWWSFNESTCINKYSLEEYGRSHEFDILEWKIEASNDGVNWTELHHVSLSDSIRRYNGHFVNGTEYFHYRFRAIRMVRHRSTRVGSFKLIEAQLDFGDKYKRIDTTSVTAGEIPSRVFVVSGGLAFSVEDDFRDAVPDHTDYEIGVTPVDLNDPFGDGSLVARFPFENDGDDATGNVSSTNVNSVSFALDSILGRKVADFSGAKRYFQTDLKLGDDLKTSYTISFKAMRFSLGRYDVAYTECRDLGGRNPRSGANWQFDDNDCRAGGSHGAYHTHGTHRGRWSGGRAKTNICTLRDTTKWNRYTTTVENGKRFKLFINCARIVSHAMRFFRGRSNLALSIGALVKDRGAERYNFNGKMADFEIYNRALSEDEVLQLCKRDEERLFATVYYEPFIYVLGTKEIRTKVSLHKENDEMLELSAALYGKQEFTLSAEDSIGGEDGTHWYLSNILLNEYTLCKE